ncbi:MAG: AraC family transcriptional regulator [Nodosilinea sp.]
MLRQDRAVIEQAKAWQSPIFTDLEVLHATYRTHRFSRHVHEDFCVGIIVDGVEAVSYRGAIHTAPKGSIVVLQPDEGHSNWAAADGGWSFRVIYPPARLLQGLIAEDIEQKAALPFFADPVICDRTLFRQLAHVHTLLAQPAVEDRLPPHAYLTHLRIAQAKQQLRQGQSLNQLALELGFVDQSHFTKTFKASVGVTPGQYRTQLKA